MKKTLIISFALLSFTTTFAQLTAKITLKEPLEGICNYANIYSLMSYQEGQIEAEPNLSEKQIEQNLNDSLKFLKNFPKFKGKGYVTVIINCKGVPLRVKAKMFKERNEELEVELTQYFKTLTDWKPGTYYKRSVDSDRSYSFSVKKGVISF